MRVARKVWWHANDDAACAEKQSVRLCIRDLLISVDDCLLTNRCSIAKLTLRLQMSLPRVRGRRGR
jgi:hypothetical protein